MAGKFAFSTVWALIMALSYVLFSDWMLNISPALVVMHALTIVVCAVGLSGISVGLGAALPNFRETDPSKIAVGFGGTINLLLSLIFLMIVILLMAAPAHIRAAFEHNERLVRVMSVVIWPGVAAGMVFGAAAVFLSLRLGNRALRSMEF